MYEYTIKVGKNGNMKIKINAYKNSRESLKEQILFQNNFPFKIFRQQNFFK